MSTPNVPQTAANSSASPLATRSGTSLMIPGIRVDFGGGRTYLLPPLSLGALELLQQRLADLPNLSPTDPQAVSTTIDATLMALRRNYPALTREEVAELVDLGNMGDVYEALMDVSGVKRKALAAEAEASAGNAAAEGQPTGADSSPSSAPTPVGPGVTSENTSTSPASMP